MSDSKKQDPYKSPVQSGSEKGSASIFWMIPGGALGILIGFFIIQRPDELFGGGNPIILLVMLTIWGIIGLIGSLIWRIPRYFIWGSIKTTALARFISGINVVITCMLVLQMGRTRIIDFPEPTMGIIMISMMVGCIIGCVEFEAWYGKQIG